MQLNAKQQDVVECLDNCLAVACPGSGKTRVLVKKTGHILKLDPTAKILIVSFTADSAREIKFRLLKQAEEENNHKLRGLIAGNVGTGTFHSIGLNQLTEAKIKSTVLNAGQMREYIARSIMECQANISIEDAQILIEEAKLDPEYYGGNDIKGKLFAAYTVLTERNNVIDFTDMLAKPVRMMAEGALAPKKCHHLMVDEAQDLDQLQYAWCAAHIKAGAKITVVGDDDQSIYRFRRALGYKGMMRFNAEFDAKIITLDTNYRCNLEILEPAKKLIGLNSSRVDKKLIASRGAGGNVQVWHCGGQTAEAELLVNAILESCIHNKIPPPRTLKDKKGDEFTYVYSVGVEKEQWAVFARNNHNLRTITSALKSACIPYSSSVQDIWDDRPVCFVLGLMRSIITKERAGYDAALHYAGLDSEVLERLHKDFDGNLDRMFDRHVTYEEYGSHSTVELLTDFAEKVRGWKRSAKKEFAAHLIQGIFDWFRRNHRPIETTSSADAKKARYAIIKELKKLDTAERLIAMQKGSILERVERLRAKPDPSVPGVIVGTLHSSKGLEFDNVWLASIDDGVIPDLKDDSIESEEEERRLFYVGMTRARNNLYISSGERVSTFVEETGLKPKVSHNFQKSTEQEKTESAE